MKTNQCGSYVPCRAILDSASQLNPIASNGVEQSSSTICEIGDGSIQVNTSVDIDIKSRHNWFSATFNVMEFIADLPERRHNVPVVTPLSNSSMQCKYQSSYPRIKFIFLYLQILEYQIVRTRGCASTPMDLKKRTQWLVKNIQMIHFS